MTSRVLANNHFIRLVGNDVQHGLAFIMLLWAMEPESFKPTLLICEGESLCWCVVFAQIK